MNIQEARDKLQRATNQVQLDELLEATSSWQEVCGKPVTQRKEDMQLYLAVKFGVHYRTICGIFPTAEEAKEQCLDSILEDKDDWHYYGVAEYLLRQGVNCPDDITPFWTVSRDMSEVYRHLRKEYHNLWKQNPLVKIEECMEQPVNPLTEKESVCQSTKTKSTLLLDSRTLIP